MTVGDVLLLLGMDLVLATVVALWARAWHRRPLLWALIAFIATPFGFLFVVVGLLVMGRSKDVRA